MTDLTRPDVIDMLLRDSLPRNPAVSGFPTDSRMVTHLVHRLEDIENVRLHHSIPCPSNRAVPMVTDRTEMVLRYSPYPQGGQDAHAI